MTEPLATLITRTVTVNEVMDQDGELRLDYEADEMTLWDVRGMLSTVVIGLDAAIAKIWAPVDDD